MKKVTIVGLGYVGLPLAISIAEAGFKTIGFDINSSLIRNLKDAISHVEDVTNSTLKSIIKNESILFTDNADEIKESDIYIITVPTPLNENREPDISYIENAARIIGSSVTKDALIVNESTSFPGTLREVVIPNVRDNLKSEVQTYFAAAPERVDPGNKNWNVKNTPRLISGIDSKSSQYAIDFYSNFCSKVIRISTPEIAETAKLFENTFRQTNIALVNEFSMICEALGLDVFEVLEAAATKPIGFMKFNPGIGVGGHCIPVDPTFLAYAAARNGFESQFIKLSNKINYEMPKSVYEKIRKYRDLKNKQVLVIGIAYKRNIADYRESPGVRFLEILRENGINAVWYDPMVKSWLNEESERADSKKYDLGIYLQHHDLNDLAWLEKSCDEIIDLTESLQCKNSKKFSLIGNKN